MDALKEDPLVEDYGLRRVLGLPTQEPFQKTHVEVAYSDANNAQWTYATPTTGTSPRRDRPGRHRHKGAGTLGGHPGGGPGSP